MACRIRRSCVCGFRVTFAATNYASALTSSNNSCHSPDSLAPHLGLLRVFPMVTFPPHLLYNSPRLNDLAIRSNEYLTSKRLLLITFRFRATIPHGIGAPATYRRAALLINSLPALFSELCVDSAPSASLYPEPRRERYPLPEKHQNSNFNYL